jgi:hypothetical protein
MLAKMRIFKKNPVLAQSSNAPTPVAESGSGMDLSRSRLLQLLLWALAIATVVWAFSDPRFRDAEGSLDSSVGVPVATAVALLLVGWAVARPLKSFSFWFALALIGQAVTLQLIEAGPSLRFQHYIPFDRLFAQTQPFLLAFLTLQTLLVSVGLRKYYIKVWRWLRVPSRPGNWWPLGWSSFYPARSYRRRYRCILVKLDWQYSFRWCSWGPSS